MEQGASGHAVQFRGGYKDVPITPPSGGTTPDGVSRTYEANDASAADLDGGGAPDFVLKWQPVNAKDELSGTGLGSPNRLLQAAG